MSRAPPASTTCVCVAHRECLINISSLFYPSNYSLSVGPLLGPVSVHRPAGKIGVHWTKNAMGKKEKLALVPSFSYLPFFECPLFIQFRGLCLPALPRQYSMSRSRFQNSFYLSLSTPNTDRCDNVNGLIKKPNQWFSACLSES